MSENRSAEIIAWEAPGVVQMSLTPEPGGSLQAEVANGVIAISGKQCRHRQGEHAKRPKDVAQMILAEVQMTILTSHCFITWKSVVDAEKSKEVFAAR